MNANERKPLEPVAHYVIEYRKAYPTDEDMRQFAAKLEPVDAPPEALRIIEANFWTLL